MPSKSAVGGAVHEPQSFHSIEASQGIDAAKKIKGRKRHLVTGTPRLILAVIVTAASVHDSAGSSSSTMSPPRTRASSRSGPTVATRPPASITEPAWASTSKWSSSSVSGFRPLPKRWVIERIFGWLMRHRLARDYEALPQRSRAMIHWAMADALLELGVPACSERRSAGEAVVEVVGQCVKGIQGTLEVGAALAVGDGEVEPDEGVGPGPSVRLGK